MTATDHGAPSIAEEPRQRPRRWLSLEAWLEARLDAERDQLPLFVPVGLGAGIAAWFWLGGESAWIAFLLAAFGLALGFGALTGRRWSRALAVFALLAGLGCGLIWLRSEQVAAPRLERPVVVAFQATIVEVQPLPARDTTRLVLQPHGGTLPPKVRVNVMGDLPQAKAGQIIDTRARLMPPAPKAVPGAYDFARVAWFQGIGATGSALGPVRIVAQPKESGLALRLSEWRRSLTRHIQSRLDEETGGIAAALVTGDRGAVAEEDDEAMRQSGLAHLLSISGLHVTAVVGAAMLLTLRLLALSPALALRWPLVLVAAGAGAVAGVAYTLLAGAEVPTVRSCVAALLVLGGLALGREAVTLRLVAAGALIVLLFWPEALAGPSFQLSFAAVTAIIALHEHPRLKALFMKQEREGWGGRLWRGLISLLVTGLAVEVALAPIALFHFHKAGVYGALANIVAIPLTTFVIMPAEALALLFDTLGLGAPFWWIVQQALHLLLSVARTTAATPGAVAMLPSMPAAAFALFVAGGIWLALWRTRWRFWGLAPFAAGLIWALMTPPPDLIVTGDGRHLAVRGEQGMAILRPRAGDYVRDMLSESAGIEAELPAIEDIRGTACSPDLCLATIEKDRQQWRLLATRSAHYVDFAPLSRACADADIVVSDRMLPRTCVPRWLKADRAFLRETGGLAITFGDRPRIRTVADSVKKHPWAY